jgi:hypothetical protein
MHEVFPLHFRPNSWPFTPSHHGEGNHGGVLGYQGAGQQKQFALAHRSGLGRVVLMHTTDVDLGPGQYTLITQNGECANIWYCNPSNIVISYITSSVKMLTESQQTPEWFLLRKF